jgi:hypothetical protein
MTDEASDYAEELRRMRDGDARDPDAHVRSW